MSVIPAVGKYFLQLAGLAFGSAFIAALVSIDLAVVMAEFSFAVCLLSRRVVASSTFLSSGALKPNVITAIEEFSFVACVLIEAVLSVSTFLVANSVSMRRLLAGRLLRSSTAL